MPLRGASWTKKACLPGRQAVKKQTKEGLSHESSRKTLDFSFKGDEGIGSGVDFQRFRDPWSYGPTVSFS
jgi:hypothetical protein